MKITDKFDRDFKVGQIIAYAPSRYCRGVQLGIIEKVDIKPINWNPTDSYMVMTIKKLVKDWKIEYNTGDGKWKPNMSPEENKYRRRYYLNYTRKVCIYHVDRCVIIADTLADAVNLGIISETVANVLSGEKIETEILL